MDWIGLALPVALGLHHEVAALVRSVLLLPGLALVAELVHFARRDRPVLLPSRERDDLETVKVQRPDSVVEAGQVLLGGDGGDELEADLANSQRQSKC